MILSTNRQMILTMLFLIHFIFYAISPLSSTLTEKSDVANSSGLRGAEKFSEDIHIWSWEIIFTRFSLRDDISDCPFPIRVLMKKARAIIPEKAVVKSTYFEKNGVIPQSLLSLHGDLTLGVAAFFSLGKSMEGASFLFSGLSPPLV